VFFILWKNRVLYDNIKKIMHMGAHNMRTDFSKEEINTLLDALTSGEIDDAGLKSSSAAVSNMKQKDIDMLVDLIQELQKYHAIGTPEECEEYKKKALGL